MSVKTVDGLNLYDPNENIGGNQYTSYGFGNNPDNNNAVNQEDLIMYCNLRAFTRPRSYIMTSNSDGVKTQAVASGRINFLKPNKDKDKFTTDWTELDASGKPNGEEMLGINSVQITYDTSYIPRVTITMTDVRGQALNEDPKDSPYGAFFNFPYPMFVLEVKGYYGKAVKYLLHLLKYSSRFDYSTGNFQITCEFVGFTYALLSDLSVQYGLVAAQMTLNGKSAKERLWEKFKLQYDKYKDIPGFSTDISLIIGGTDSFSPNKGVYTLVDLINKAKDLSTFVESLGQDNKKFREKAALDNFIDVIQRLYDSISKKEDILNQWFNTQVKNINADSLFVEFPEYKQQLECNVTTTGNPIDLINQQTIDGYNNYYNNAKNVITSKNTEIQKDLNDEVKSQLTSFLGFKPSIRNIMLIICNNFELFLDLLTETTQRAADNDNRKKVFNGIMKDGNPKRDNKELEQVFPWPALYNDNYEICYFDDIPTLKAIDYPEKEFVESYLSATQYTNKLLAVTGTSNTVSTEITNPVKFNPIHTQQYDSNTLKKPIFDIDINKILIQIVEHALLISSNSWSGKDLTRQLNSFGKVDANNLYAQLGNKGIEKCGDVLTKNLYWINDSKDNKTGNQDLGILQTITGNKSAVGTLNNPFEGIKKQFQYIKDYSSEYLTDIVETQDITNLKSKYGSLQNLRFVPEVTGNLLGVGEYGAGSVTTDGNNGFIYYEKKDDYKLPEQISLEPMFKPFMEVREINGKEIKYINKGSLEDKDNILKSLINVLKKIQQSGSILGPEELLVNIPGITDSFDFILFNGIHKTKMVRVLSTLFFDDNYVIDNDSYNNGDKISQLKNYRYYFPFTTNKFPESKENDLSTYIFNRLAFLDVYKELLINQLSEISPSLNDISELELYREKLDGSGFKINKDGVVGLDPTTSDGFKKSVNNKVYIDIYTNIKEFFETPIQMVAKSKGLSDIYKDPYKYWTNDSNWVNKGVTNPKKDIITYNNISYNNYNSGSLISFYLTGFRERITEIVKTVTDNDKNNPESGSNTAGVKTASDLKRSLYQTFKNINDKWVIDKPNGGKNQYSWGLEGDVDPNNNNELKYNPKREFLFDHLFFVDRVNRDIGNEVLLDFRVLYNYYDKVNTKNSLYSIIGELAKMNEMIFHPLTSYISFNGATSNKASIDNLFKPTTALDFQSTSPVFIMQYVGKNASYQYENQNHLPDVVKIDFSGNGKFLSPSDSPFKDITNRVNEPVAFFVDMGIKNQNMFRGISLDQAEFRETNESITVWDQLTSQKESRSIQTIGNNIYPILSRRSYTCKVESLGNMMIQPTMYFYLRYIPLFSGLYLITKVSHSIQPNNVVTNFEGVRMSSLNFPFVSEFVSTITKEILEKGAGAVTPYLTKEDPNWWGNLKDNTLKTRIVTFNNTIKTKINNPAVQAAMIAIVYKESKLAPKSESSYAGTNKFKTFNAFANLTPYTTEGPGGIETSQFINELKKKDTTFFNFVYGNKNGNDPKTAKLNPINITDSNGKVITVYDDLNGDGYKYRGRGYNQITGKSLYERAKKDTGVDVVTNPDLLNNINTAALALLGYFERGATGKVQEPTNKDNLFYKVYSRTPLKDYVPTDYQKAYNTLFSINAGTGKSMEVHLSNDIKKGGYNDGYFILQSIYNAIIAGEIK